MIRRQRRRQTHRGSNLSLAASPPPAFVSWSSGKDSAFAVVEARRLGLAEIVGALTTINEVHDRVSMHGVRTAVLDRQMEALGLPCLKVALPSPCPNEVYEARMADAVDRLKADGVLHIVFGDLFLEDIRTYREERLAAAGMTGIFPLWRRDTRELASNMIRSGLLAHLVTIDPRKLDRGFAGRRFDHDLLSALPPGVDPCGENGEFHTLVSAGPMFSAPIRLTAGATVERDGFMFADFKLSEAVSSVTSAHRGTTGPAPLPPRRQSKTAAHRPSSRP